MSSVDVIIPLYNGKKWIRATLESVLAQTHRPGKVIVVDDGSSDGSQKAVRDIDGVTFLENTEVHGYNSARNFALKYSDRH